MTYDDFAEQYDSFFKDENSVNEDRAVIRMIDAKPDERVLDIGCGTGLFIDYTNHPIANYLGVDTSAGMLKVFKRKHPRYVTIQTKLTQVSADLTVSLYGSANHLSMDYLRAIRKGSKRIFLMFYKPKYMPETYLRIGRCLEHNIYNIHDLKELGNPQLFGNFIIVT